MRKIAILLVAILLGLSAAPVSAASPPRSMTEGPNTSGRYAMLTYDDCIYAPWTGAGQRNTTEHARTPQEAMANYKATIGVLVEMKAAVVIVPTGRCVNRFKRELNFDMVTYARYHGMYVMSHTANHLHLPTLGKPGIRWQIRNSPATYWIRPPYGDVNQKVIDVARRMHKHIWLWTWSGADWSGFDQARANARVVNDTVTNCRSGSTCLQHLDANGFNPEAIRQTVEGMRGHGTRVCGLRNRDGRPLPTKLAWRRLWCWG